MIQEISYEKYKDFCSKLPCKDAFYFIKNLFVKFPYDDTVYSIKYDFKQNPEVSYNEVVSNGDLEIVSLAKFLEGLPTTDVGVFIKDEVYREKSFLVIL